MFIKLKSMCIKVLNSLELPMWMYIDKEDMYDKYLSIFDSLCPSCMSYKKYLSFLEDNVSEVYSHVSGLSKINYYASGLIPLIDEYQDKHYKDYYKSDMIALVNAYKDKGSKEELIEAVPNARSVPQIFIDEEYVGGFTELSLRLAA